MLTESGTTMISRCLCSVEIIMNISDKSISATLKSSQEDERTNSGKVSVYTLVHRYDLRLYSAWA
jgi:hypothetical protein